MLATTVSGLIALISLDLSTAWLDEDLNRLRWLSAAFAAIVAVAASLAIVLHERFPSSRITKAVFRTASEFGRPEITFTLITLISVVGVYANDPLKASVIISVWAIFLAIRPVEVIWTVVSKFVAASSSETKSTTGTILRVDHPGVFRVSLPSHKDWKPSTLKIAALPDGSQEYVLALFSQIQGAQIVGTGISVASVAQPESIRPGTVVDSHDPDMARDFLAKISGVSGAELVGFCIENTDIGNLRFEASEGSLLQDGGIVFLQIRGKLVFYQIIEARTSEESFDQNPKGAQIVSAVQLGEFDAHKGFSKFDWIPEMNTPVFWADAENFEVAEIKDNSIEIGRLPAINVPISANIDELVTHHIAILGATGTGKTEFAFDLIDGLLEKGIKILCVDFTGDYRTRFDRHNIFELGPGEEAGLELEAKLFDVETGEFKSSKEKRVLDEALKEMRDSAEKQVNEFIRSDNHSIALFELS